MGGVVTARPGRRRGRTGLERFRLFPDFREGVQLPQPFGQDPGFEAWRAEHGGSFAEYKIWEALVDQGLVPFEDFFYQHPLFGGRQEEGGAIIDFFLWTATPPVAVRVQGEYWHRRSIDQQTFDEMQRVRIEQAGFTVVDIQERDALNRPQAAVEAALRGEEL